MQNKTMKLNLIRAGNLAPGDVHERCTDCEIHHEAANAGNGEGYVLLKGSQKAVAAVAGMLYEPVRIVPYTEGEA